MRTQITTPFNDRRIMLICIGLIVLSLGSILAVLFLQYRLGQYHPVGYTPQLTTRERNVTLDKAAHLREKWKTWALAHESDLKHMLHASGDGYAEVDRVWHLLPKPPRFEGAGFPVTDLTSNPVFTWTVTLNDVKKLPLIQNDKTTLERFNRSHAFLEDQRRQYAARYHDLAISHSIGQGKVWYTLWASGRITKTTLPDHYEPGKSPTSQYQDEEVAPRYDFLQ